jgi:hypothetical protein
VLLWRCARRIPGRAAVVALSASKPANPQRRFDVCMRVWTAVPVDPGGECAGRPFNRLPSPEPARDIEAFAMAMRDACAVGSWTGGRASVVF